MSSKQQRPNILFVLSDQQRWDTLGCYGQPLEITPNLDHMAREGVRFECAFTPQPVCGPARACLQTGRYATETGCFTNLRGLPGSERTIAHWLSEAGYETAYIGKWHLASRWDERDLADKPVPPDRRGGYENFWLAAEALEFTSHGYDGFLWDAAMKRVEFKGYRADALTDFALGYLQQRARDVPDRTFFLFLSYIEPHQQNDRGHFEGPLGSKERFVKFVAPADLLNADGDWRQEFPDYLGCCWSLDRNVGRLRAELKRLAIEENTLLIYTSDHGCHFRTRNSEYKRSCHEASIRVPLILCGPGFRGGKTISELVSLLDLPPTLLAAGGIEKSASMRGRPLQGLVSNAAGEWPQEVFIQISEDHIGRAIRTKRWKYSIWVPRDQAYRSSVERSGSDCYVEQCLYDLQSDPHEQRNLVTDPRYCEVRHELAEALKRRMLAVGEPEPRIEPCTGGQPNDRIDVA